MPPPRDPAGCWLCAEVRPGREQVAAEQLRLLGFETYVPIGELPREDGNAHGARQRGPLFPGYVFLRFGQATLTRWSETLERSVSVLDAPELIGIIRHANGEPWPMQPGDMARLLERTRDGVIPLPVMIKARIAVGDRVRVIEGPFAGFHARVLMVAKRRLMVEVMVFGRLAPTELDRSSVERV